MTTPQEPTPQEDPGAAELAVAALAVIVAAAAAAALAALLAGAAGVAGTAAQTVGAIVARPRGRTVTVTGPERDYRGEALRILIGTGIQRPAASAVLSAFWGRPLPDVHSGGAGVAAGQAGEAPAWRARYLLTAARRVDDAVDRAARDAEAAGDDRGRAQQDAVLDALQRERRYWDQHLDAQARRVANAALLDEAHMNHGPWLRWMSQQDERVTRECRVAHGHLFRVDQPPLIGLPGTGPHYACRCYPAPPSAARGRLTVDEALARAGITRHDH